VTYIQTDFPVTAICLAEAGNELFTGGIDNDIKVWDLRKQAVTYTLLGHTDTVTSLQMSPDNQTLLSNAHDSTVRTWDVRPFAPADRRIQTYDGAPTGQERNLLKASWDSTGEKIAAGSGDQSVAIWETRTGKLLNKLPGHRGTVNDVRFHPRGEPICKFLQPLPALSSSRFFRCLRSEAAIPDALTHPSNMVLQKTLRCGGFVFGVLALRMSELLKTSTRLFHAFHSIYRTT
jgi:WD40 repeat protein